MNNMGALKIYEDAKISGQNVYIAKLIIINGQVFVKLIKK
tara:strand:+ start:1023 stop:1142 length:120 start_codon:yes stop_codon:yes gene_type:complete